MYLKPVKPKCVMRPFFILVLMLCCSASFAQEAKRASSFKAITYNIDGSVWNTRVELIKGSAGIYDLYFVDKNFYTIPLPASFVSEQYKSQKVETTNGNDQKSKRTKNVVYDEFGRVVGFGITGCLICNDLGYQFNVHYNVNNQVDTMTGAPDSFSRNTKYEIRYYANGDVRQIDHFIAGKLSVQITLF